MVDRKQHTGVEVTRPQSASTWSLSRQEPILICKHCFFVLQGSLQCLMGRFLKYINVVGRLQRTKFMKVDENFKADCVGLIKQSWCHSRWRSCRQIVGCGGNAGIVIDQGLRGVVFRFASSVQLRPALIVDGAKSENVMRDTAGHSSNERKRSIDCSHALLARS
jgi:hypothetical protein